MTDDKIALQDLLEKSSDAILLREMIGFAAQRLMALVEVMRRHKGAVGDVDGEAIDTCTRSIRRGSGHGTLERWCG